MARLFDFGNRLLYEVEKSVVNGSVAADESGAVHAEHDGKPL